MTKLKENLIVIIATLFLAGSIIFFVNSGNLSTDVLGKSINQQKNTQDVQFAFNSGTIDMIAKKDIENVASVTIELMFDSSKVKLSKDDFNSPFDISLAKKEGGNGYDIILQNINDVNVGKTILSIKHTIEEQFDNINIGHIQIIDNNGNIMNLTSSRQ